MKMDDSRKSGVAENGHDLLTDGCGFGGGLLLLVSLAEQLGLFAMPETLSVLMYLCGVFLVVYASTVSLLAGHLGRVGKE